MTESFDDLNLTDNLLRGIYSYGFENPSPIQGKAIPIMNEKKEHIYLIQEREFIKTEEPIYKLGKTHNIFQRKSGYPNRMIFFQKRFCNY